MKSVTVILILIAFILLISVLPTDNTKKNKPIDGYKPNKTYSNPYIDLRFKYDDDESVFE